MSLILYELRNAQNQSMSPYCWRVRESLALLSVPYESRLLGLTEIGEQFTGDHKTVPVLGDSKTEIGGSWAIAEYLSENYDPHQQLFGSADNYRLAAFVTNWVDATVLGVVNRMLVKDIHDGLDVEDQAYYRASEEKKLGKTIEEIQAAREGERPAFQIALHPVRQTIKQQPFIAGQNPTYADFAVHSTFQWIRLVTEFEFLRTDDRIHEWIDRMDKWLAAHE